MKKKPGHVPERFSDIDEYHATFPSEIQTILQQLRLTIKQAAPQAAEIISYNMPAFKNIVSYAGYKNHIGFYPGSKAIVIFSGELTKFKTSKGAIQFPVNKPLPTALIKKIVKFRVVESAKTLKVKKS